MAAPDLRHTGLVVQRHQRLRERLLAMVGRVTMLVMWWRIRELLKSSRSAKSSVLAELSSVETALDSAERKYPLKSYNRNRSGCQNKSMHREHKILSIPLWIDKMSPP